MGESVNQKIHIAHVLYGFVTGGLENGIVNIINHLPEDQYTHSIISIDAHDPEFAKRIKTQNYQLYDLNKGPSHFAWYFDIWKLLRKIKPDVCHSRNLSAIEAQFPATFAGIKYRIHGEHGWDVFDVGGTNVKYQKLRKAFKPFINRYVALSVEAQDYLLNKIAVKKDKIVRICNGVDIKRFNPSNEKPSFDSFVIEHDDIVFGTVGRLAQVKNQGFLLDAFIQLVEQNPQQADQLKLVIIGDGILMPELKEKVRQFNLEGQVYLPGKRSDVANCLTRLSVFVLPSLAEGISNTLLEAMASGVPYIATNVGGNGDLIYPEHAHSHLVAVGDVPALANAMQLYVDNKELIEQHGKEVRRHCVDNFSIENMVGKYHDLYQSAYVKGK